MTYTVKEIFKTIQGEGVHAGRAAVFCRFTGCNLWSGREQDRAAAHCRFCDTDFVGGSRYNANDLVNTIAATWGDGCEDRFVVFTGGEPLLQLDRPLIDGVSARGFYIAVETNGTINGPSGIDWVCVSPKAGTEIKQTVANELKVVFPQLLNPEIAREMVAADHYSIQPMDGDSVQENTRAAIAYVLAHPHWRLSLQTHKMAGIR